MIVASSLGPSDSFLIGSGRAERSDPGGLKSRSRDAGLEPGPGTDILRGVEPLTALCPGVPGLLGLPALWLPYVSGRSLA